LNLKQRRPFQFAGAKLFFNTKSTLTNSKSSIVFYGRVVSNTHRKMVLKFKSQPNRRDDN